MGKGDKKTRRGKISNRSYGVRRPKTKKSPAILEKVSTDKKPKAVSKTVTKAKK
ncbi:MAG TPA: 30S ribosomal protein THX [Flavobacteriaceae bacterium]|jgi:30S ribosomal protein S31